MSAAETPCDNWGGSGTAARSSDTIVAVTSSSWLEGGVGDELAHVLGMVTHIFALFHANIAALL